MAAPAAADTNVVDYVYVRITGGKKINTASLAPKLGAKGVSPKTAESDIINATKGWEGIKVTVELKIQNRKVTAIVVPTASALIIKEMKKDSKYSKEEKSPHKGNISLEALKTVARTIRHKSYSKNFQNCCLELLGTCLSIGASVDGLPVKEVIEKIKAMKKNNESMIPDEPIPKDQEIKA